MEICLRNSALHFPIRINIPETLAECRRCSVLPLGRLASLVGQARLSIEGKWGAPVSVRVDRFVTARSPVEGPSTIDAVQHAGADVAVVGAAIYGASDPIRAAKELGSAIMWRPAP